MNTFVHRELDREDEPDGYRVSDREYMEANRFLVIHILDAISDGTFLPDDIDLMRAIKLSGARKQGDIAKVTAAIVKQHILGNLIVPPKPEHLK